MSKQEDEKSLTPSLIQKARFKDTPREEIIKTMQEEGFDPRLFTDEPRFIYNRHQHPETKLIVCLEGSMEVSVLGEQYDFEKGDRLKIPGNTPHSAAVGPRGCTFFWSERIVSQKI